MPNPAPLRVRDTYGQVTPSKRTKSPAPCLLKTIWIPHWHNPRDFGIARKSCLDLLVPISLIMQEVIFVERIQHGLEKEPDDTVASHVAEAAIRGGDATGDDSEFPVRDLLAEQIVFGVERVFVKAAQLIEPCFREQHVHAGAERAAEQRSVLRQIIEEIKGVVGEMAASAPDVGSDAVHVATLGQFNGTANQSWVFQLHVSVDKEDKWSRSLFGARIAANRGQSAGNDLNAEASGEAHCQFRRAVSGSGISNEYFGIPHLRVVLFAERLQQVRQKFRLVLGRYHDCQRTLKRIHGWPLLPDRWRCRCSANQPTHRSCNTQLRRAPCLPGHACVRKKCAQLCLVLRN